MLVVLTTIILRIQFENLIATLCLMEVRLITFIVTSGFRLVNHADVLSRLSQDYLVSVNCFMVTAKMLWVTTAAVFK